MLLVLWRTIRSSYIARDSVVIYFFPILDLEAHPASWAVAVPMVSLVLLCSEVLGVVEQDATSLQTLLRAPTAWLWNSFGTIAQCGLEESCGGHR